MLLVSFGSAPWLTSTNAFSPTYIAPQQQLSRSIKANGSCLRNKWASLRFRAYYMITIYILRWTIIIIIVPSTCNGWMVCCGALGITRHHLLEHTPERKRNTKYRRRKVNSLAFMGLIYGSICYCRFKWAIAGLGTSDRRCQPAFASLHGGWNRVKAGQRRMGQVGCRLRVIVQLNPILIGTTSALFPEYMVGQGLGWSGFSGSLDTAKEAAACKHEFSSIQY